VGKAVLYGLLLAAGCGRYGFEGGPDDPAPDAATSALRCGNAPKFSVGTLVRDVAAIATSQGFALFTVDEAKELRGWSYGLDAGALTAEAQNVALDIDVTGAFGASAAGDDIVIGAIHGAMTTLGTTYHALDAGLAERSTPVISNGRVIGVEPLARCATQPGLASIRHETGDVAVHGIATNGSDLGTRMLGVAAENPNELSIITAGTGYAVAWIDTIATPNTTKLALLDENYAFVKGPVTVMNTAGFDTIRPRIRWAPGSNTYAVAWFEKTPTGDDDVYAQVFDAQLQPMFAPKLVETSAVRPKLATDGTSFYIGYLQVAANPDRMQTAHLTTDGTLTIRSAASSGGTPLAFSMVERAGQAVLVYVESKTSVDVWFEALCP